MFLIFSSANKKKQKKNLRARKNLLDLTLCCVLLYFMPTPFYVVLLLSQLHVLCFFLRGDAAICFKFAILPLSRHFDKKYRPYFLK